MSKKAEVTISALAGRLSDLHFARQMIEKDRKRYSADVPLADRAAALDREIKGVERQISLLIPSNPYEVDVARLVNARIFGAPASITPNDNTVADLSTFCGGHYQTAAAVSQFVLPL